MISEPARLTVEMYKQTHYARGGNQKHRRNGFTEVFYRRKPCKDRKTNVKITKQRQMWIDLRKPSARTFFHADMRINRKEINRREMKRIKEEKKISSDVIGNDY